jgi:transcription elongation factor S-II
MASESVRALNEKIASDNLFKAKAVGETQVSALHSDIASDMLIPLGRDRCVQVWSMSAEEVHLLPDADEKCR